MEKIGYEIQLNQGTLLWPMLSINRNGLREISWLHACARVANGNTAAPEESPSIDSVAFAV